MSVGDETLAERFVRLTDEAGLEPAEVACIMGTSEGTVYKIRRGEVKAPGLIGMLRLAKRLGVSPYYLACESGAGNAASTSYNEVDIDGRIEALEQAIGHPDPAMFGDDELALKALAFRRQAIRESLEQLFLAMGPDYVRSDSHINEAKSLAARVRDIEVFVGEEALGRTIKEGSPSNIVDGLNLLHAHIAEIRTQIEDLAAAQLARDSALSDIKSNLQ